MNFIPRDGLINKEVSNFIYTIKYVKVAMLHVNVLAFFYDNIGVDDQHITVGMPVVIDGNERLQPNQPVTVDGEEI